MLTVPPAPALVRVSIDGGGSGGKSWSTRGSRTGLIGFLGSVGSIGTDAEWTCLNDVMQRSRGNASTERTSAPGAEPAVVRAVQSTLRVSFLKIRFTSAWNAVQCSAAP